MFIWYGLVRLKRDIDTDEFNVIAICHESNLGNKHNHFVCEFKSMIILLIFPCNWIWASGLNIFHAYQQEYTSVLKSRMAEWLEQESQWHEMYCHDLGLMSSNPGVVELGLRSTSICPRLYLNHKQDILFVWKHVLLLDRDIELKVKRSGVQFPLLVMCRSALKHLNSMLARTTQPHEYLMNKSNVGSIVVGYRRWILPEKINTFGSSMTQTEVLRTPSSTRLELMTSRSWQFTSCHWDTCSNHLAISGFHNYIACWLS